MSVYHSHADDPTDPHRQVSGGVAAGDFDGDGWPDLYVVGGDGSRQFLFRNRGDGTFVDVTAAAGVGLEGQPLSGPVFADINGDRRLDLFVGTVGSRRGRRPHVLLQQASGTFEPVEDFFTSFFRGAYTSASFGDFDGDGRLDLLTTHWSTPRAMFRVEHLWRNRGRGRFRPVTRDMGLGIAIDREIVGSPVYFSFTGNFADIDSDGWPDILLASDFALSQVFRNREGRAFVDTTTPAISDENGMGAAVGDFDNDGHLDWFVTSIFDPFGEAGRGWGSSGNRLYRNRGDGSFEDVTEVAGVRDGAWGWGACFADFDNDGWLDIFHVNGWISPPDNRWLDTPARLFMNNRDGTFSERAVEFGIADPGDGRGVVCFDYDRDGDIDVFIANLNGPARLFRNDLAGPSGFLQVQLVGRPPNTEAIGARVYLRSRGGPDQMRELRAGSNFVSQDPAIAHFGLGSVVLVDELEIRWPHRSATTLLHDIAANQHLVVFQVDGDANCDGTSGAADITAVTGAIARAASAAPCPGRDMNYDGWADAGDLHFVISQIFGRRV